MLKTPPRVACSCTAAAQGMAGVTDVGISALRALPALRCLEVQFCWQFSDAGLMALTGLSALSKLDLLYSWQVGDDALRALGGMTSLVSLNVMGCHRVTAEGRAAVAHLTAPPHCPGRDVEMAW